MTYIYTAISVIFIVEFHRNLAEEF